MPLEYTPPLRDLIDIYMAANTPVYPFKRLRQHHHVRAMAERNSPTTLAGQVRQLPLPSDRQGEDVALAYGCLAALSIHSDPRAADELRSLDLSALNWGAFFVEASELRFSGTQRLILNAAPRPSLVAHSSRSPSGPETVNRDMTPHAIIDPAPPATGSGSTLVILRP